MMRSPTHGAQPVASFGQRTCLGDQTTLEGQGLVRPQYPGVRVLARHRQGLDTCEFDCKPSRICRIMRCLDRILVDVSDLYREDDPGIGQHRPTSRAL